MKAKVIEEFAGKFRVLKENGHTASIKKKSAVMNSEGVMVPHPEQFCIGQTVELDEKDEPVEVKKPEPSQSLQDGQPESKETPQKANPALKKQGRRSSPANT